MDTKKLRQKILDLAIRGKLVPQDPNDEPASVLLERIRLEKERLVKEGKIKRSKKTATDDEFETPFEIPESWELVRLEEIAYIGTGATPDTRYNDYYNGNIPWVSSSCTKYDYIETPSSYITQKAIDETNCRVYPKGTLIMAMYGEGKTRGQISELKIEAATNQACAAIVPYNISTAQYIKLYLKRNYLHIREQAEGGTQPNLNLSKIAQYTIALPPLAEQQRIATEVERWFAVIDALESSEGDLLKAIDQTKSKILDLAIHGKLVPQDPNDEPAIELLNRINPKFVVCENKFNYDVPNSWIYCQIQDVFNITMGSSPIGESLNRNGDGVEFHQGKLCFSDIFLEVSDVYSNQPVKLASPYSILLCVRAPVGVVNINRREVCIGRGLCSLAPLDAIHLMYGFYALQTCQMDFEQKATGSTFKAIGGDVVKTQIIPIPPYNEQFRIVAKIQELFAVLDSIKESLE